MANSSVSPGVCDWLALKWGWRLSRANIMVEGASDVRFFRLASDVNAQATGLRLLCDDLSIFAAGEGDEGGTYGIAERFPTFHNLSRLDLDGGGKRKYRVVALVDDDPMGRRAVAGMTAGNRSINEYEHVFRLRRVMPSRAGSVRALSDQTKASNAEFGNLDCVIEDLVSAKLCEEYVTKFPHHRARAPLVYGSSQHSRWELAGKRGLFEYVEKNATVTDLHRLIDVLRSLRSYVGLPPDGMK